MELEFSYFSRKQAFTLVAQAVRLLVTGKCDLSVRMDKPRDIAFLEAGKKAMEEFDSSNEK